MPTRQDVDLWHSHGRYLGEPDPRGPYPTADWWNYYFVYRINSWVRKPKYDQIYDFHPYCCRNGNCMTHRIQGNPIYDVNNEYIC